jgi:hypothetical protein
MYIAKSVSSANDTMNLTDNIDPFWLEVFRSDRLISHDDNVLLFVMINVCPGVN